MNIDKAEKILSYQIDWIRAADAKIYPIFVINLAMLGTVVTLIKAHESWTNLQSIFSVLSLLFLFFSIVFLALSMFPNINGPKSSNIFFGDITKKTENKFVEEIRGISDEAYLIDVLTQAYINASIAEKKFTYIKYAFISSFVGVPFWLISIYLIYV